MELGWVINNPKLREQLGITSQQAGKIRQETLNFEKTEIRSRADLQVKRLELHSLLAAETPDRAAIETSLRETNAAQFALEKASIDHRLDMRAMLTPEQRQKLQQLREEFFHRGAGQPRGERGTMRPGRGGMMHPGAQSAPPAQSHPQQQ
jgi:Spy/CpxP family protein refolding chaperone